jgi:hypothetical protein
MTAEEKQARVDAQRERRLHLNQQVRVTYTPHPDVSEHTASQITKALDGALSAFQRPARRGFEPWRPNEATLHTLDEVKQILEEYAANLPLTNRQVLYRMMGKFGHEKSIEDKLYELMNRARRAEMIPMDAIREDRSVKEEAQSWDDADEYIRAVQRWSQNVRLDRQDGQKKRLVVHCEATGMVPQLARVVNPVRRAGRLVRRLRQSDREARVRPSPRWHRSAVPCR